MLRQLVAKWLGLRFVCSFLLLATLTLTGALQIKCGNAQRGDGAADALTLLKEVGRRYENTTYYFIAAATEEQMNAEFSRNWSKSLTIAAVAPGNKYHFESHTNWEAWVLISDGKTEWLYRPPTQEYKKQPAPFRSPNRFKSSGLQNFLGLNDAEDTIKNLAEWPSSVRSASYIPDETLDVNGKQVSCYVIEAQGKYRPGWSPDTTELLTIWVDKENHTIRKLRERMEGHLRVNDPQERYTRENTTVYTAVDLDATSVPDSFFSFDPRPTAKLVKEFENRTHTHRDALFVGKPAPDVSLKSTDGKTISLRSFQGRPVLLDFWATWCGPCVESMPSVKRLYSEATKYGLVMLSIDEDEDAKKATDFLSENKDLWPNFHDDGEIARSFPNEGIPHFVLIDSAGTVVFSRSSFDEPALRTAIAKLGPEFATLAKTPRQ
jgi:thiol-disulfide isomerase/thioredoxin/outer membrane lipoprotein-sorting protein